MTAAVIVGATLLFSLQAEAKSPPKTSPDRAVFAELLEQIGRLSVITFPSNAETEELETSIQQLVELFPTEPAAYLWAGKWADHQFDQEEARHFWTEALKHKTSVGVVPDNQVWSNCCQLLGEQSLSTGDPAGAKEYAQKALGFQPGDPRSIRLLVDASFRTGNIDQALTAARSAYDQFGAKDLTVSLLYYDLLADTGNWPDLIPLLEQEPSERQRHLHLYRSRLAELNDEPLQALCHLLLGYWNGDQDRLVCQECQARLDRFLKTQPESLPEPIQLLVRGYHAMGREDEAQEVLAPLRAATAVSPEHQLVLDWLKATLHASLEQLTDAEQCLKRILDAHPLFLPAAVSLGEILQSHGQTEDAEKLFDFARQRSQSNGKVLELDRMGASFKPVDDGVQVTAVTEHGYWDRFGVQPGDVVLRLDQKSLAAMTPFQRLRTIRLFQGGTVAYRTKAGQEVEREMELVLFGF